MYDIRDATYIDIYILIPLPIMMTASKSEQPLFDLAMPRRRQASRDAEEP